MSLRDYVLFLVLLLLWIPVVLIAWGNGTEIHVVMVGRRAITIAQMHPLIPGAVLAVGAGLCAAFLEWGIYFLWFAFGCMLAGTITSLATGTLETPATQILLVTASACAAGATIWKWDALD